MEKPQIKDENINLEELKKSCQDYIDFIDSPSYNEDRAAKIEYYIIEAALTALYGKDVYNWINKRIEEHET